jgi:hypothetical protein
MCGVFLGVCVGALCGVGESKGRNFKSSETALSRSFPNGSHDKQLIASPDSQL